MNRIYQGKVTRVEIHDGKDAAGKPQWKELPKDEWQKTLWQHHELFQDAVNYYTLMLAVLARGCEDKAFQKEYLKEAVENAEDRNKAEAMAKAQLKAISGWERQVSGTWETAVRRAVKFNGPNKRIAGILGLDFSKAKYADCVVKIGMGYKVDAGGCARALLDLLNEVADKKNKSNQVCGERLPFLCAEPEFFNATPKDASKAQLLKSGEFLVLLHEADKSGLSSLADKIDPYLFMTAAPSSDLLDESGTIKLALKYYDKIAKQYPELKKARGQFEAEVKLKAKRTPLKDPGRKTAGEFPYAVVFRYFPTTLIWEAFKKRTEGRYKKIKKSGSGSVSKDNINALRTANAGSNPFSFFTNVAMRREADAKERAVWWDFDLAAFIEAINSPHRYFEDTKNREANAEKLRSQLTAMEDVGLEAGVGEEEEEAGELPGFKNDKRIALIRKLVTDRLGYLAEVEEPGAAAGKAEYSVSERTLRGFSKIREKWQKIAAKKLSSEEMTLKLKTILVEEQAEHRNDFGSAALYNCLIEEEFRPIWRDPGTERYHAPDPLSAWRKYQDLRRELADKERPIRFTPAHPEKSPRYFDFPKQSSLKAVHQPGITVSGAMQFVSGIVADTTKGRLPVRVRVTYTAPRLRRDNLRVEGEENLAAAAWVQPMMAALGVPEPDTQNFANTRITLMPLSPVNIQLVFPVEANSEKLQKFVSGGISWKQQFVYGKDSLAALHWPNEKMKTEPEQPWWEMVKSFSCLAVDLGQRDAGAFARLEVSQKSDGIVRYIGNAGGHKWYAKIARQGMFRLPGEDAQVWREASKKDEPGGYAFREELSGEKGRSATAVENDDTAAMLRAFGQDEAEFMPDNWRGGLSFPEQNDKLLVAARRAQARVAQLHRWAWFLNTEEKKKIAVAEIADRDPDASIPDEWKDWARTNNPKLQEAIKALINKKQTELVPLLVRLANRVLPLRGRSWQWVTNPDKRDCFLLEQSGPAVSEVKICGQRGISMERIEQITELRKRLQSLNQMLRRKPGDKAPARRDDSIPDCCPDLLEKLDNMKEQRVNQTAHMILAEALGLHLAAPGADKRREKSIRSLHGAYEKVAEPASFIVIENLSRYLTSQGRAPRENSRLMKWCHRAVRDKLKMLCEVFYPTLVARKALPPIVETPAAYSSRFCSRSGIAGFRAVEAAPGFENNAPWCWLKNKKEKDGKPSDIAANIAGAKELLERINKDKPNKPRTILLPLSGGPIFVPFADITPGNGLAPKVVQADINAAINLGLRAIADPCDWSISPRLRTRRKGGKMFAKEKRKFGDNDVPVINCGQGADSTPTSEDNNPNYFYDLTRKVGWGYAEVAWDNKKIRLVSGKALWKTVNDGAWERCREINQARSNKVLK